MKKAAPFLALASLVLAAPAQALSPGGPANPNSLPRAAVARGPRAHAALTCTSSVSYPQYHFVSNPPGVNGEGRLSCDSRVNMQIEVCTDQNWGAGWSTISQSCYTTGYYSTTQLDVWDNTVYSYCGRWYRLRIWRYVDGSNWGWVTGNANYRC